MRISLVLGALAIAVLGPGIAEAQPLIERLERLREAIAPQVLPAPQPLVVPPLGAPPLGGAPQLSGPPRLGVIVDPVTETAIRERNLVVRRGAVIRSIERGSAAEQAGLPIGGAIVAIDGIRIDSPADLVAFIQSARPGQIIELHYYDGPQLYRKSIPLSPGQIAEIRDDPESVPPLPLPASPSRSFGIPDASRSAPTETLRPPSSSATGRPLLDRLGTVLDGLVAPSGNQPASGEVRPIPSPEVNNRSESNEIRDLRQQLRLLQSQLDQLSQRLAELEGGEGR